MLPQPLPAPAACGSLPLSDYHYELPPECIAQVPAPERDLARLMVLERAGGALGHATVREIGRFLRPGDLLVFNDTRVRPARLFGRNGAGGKVELLLIRELEAGIWDCLGKPARRLTGEVIFADGEKAFVLGGEGGRYRVRFADPAGVGGLMARHGEMPLPPYIRRPDGLLPLDVERYQTVLARREGAVAAPTAGLHFTPRLLDGLAAAGVETACVTLHVGPATFLPLRVEDAAAHTLEAEEAELSEAAVAAIGAARARGGRVIAIGTTTTRALESAALRGELRPGRFAADAFVTPGFRFRVIDALLTNFHLPRSTLLMLVSAFAGRERVLAAYAVAVRDGYRFYSYGDAMLIV